ncbi:MAG: helix-turn-helix domain-containing protein [Actinomycetaceae bacterium]|nr:helix-turn-helix domain-containing protein [Actinomycetaceae bacterium]
MREDYWTGNLNLFPGAVVYYGKGGNTSWHQHLAIQLVIAHEGTFKLQRDSENTAKEETFAIIPPNQKHCLYSENPLFLLLIEPYGSFNERLLSDMSLAALSALPSAITRRRSTQEIVNILLRTGIPDRKNLSAPVLAALRYLDSYAPTPKASLPEAAKKAHISPSYLTHRFSQEIGIPFRRYAIWVRLRCAVEAITKSNMRLSDAAARAGFSDGAHLSRLFRTNFGLSPSTLLRMHTDVNDWP